MPLAALTVLSLLLAAPAAERLFSQLGLEQAVVKGRAEDRLVMAYFSAAWCGPCKRMKKVTWGDEQLAGWIEEHALAIKIDVEKKPGLKDRFRVKTVPTIIALRDGREVGRVHGMQKARPLLAWLGAMLDVEPERGVADLPLPTAAPDVGAVFRGGQEAGRAGRLHDALSAYAWIWQQGARNDPAYAVGTRVFLLAEIAALARIDEPSSLVFGDLLADLESQLGPDADIEVWFDWLDLSEALGKTGGVVEWLRERRDDSGRLGAGAEGPAADVPAQAVDRLFGVLASLELYTEAALLVDDLSRRATDRSVRHVREAALLTQQQLPDSVQEQAATSRRKSVRKELSDLYRAALTRPDDAVVVQIGQRLVEAVDDLSSRVLLVRFAARAGRVDEAQLLWLEEAEALATSAGQVAAVERLRADVEGAEDAESTEADPNTDG